VKRVENGISKYDSAEHASRSIALDAAALFAALYGGVVEQ
jgi:hypothetical protein